MSSCRIQSTSKLLVYRIKFHKKTPIDFQITGIQLSIGVSYGVADGIRTHDPQGHNLVL